MQTLIAFITTIYFEMLLPRDDPLKELVKTEARTICSVQKRIKREAKKKKEINLVKSFQHQLVAY